jgi:hypothetical protein
MTVQSVDRLGYRLEGQGFEIRLAVRLKYCSLTHNLDVLWGANQYHTNSTGAASREVKGQVCEVQTSPSLSRDVKNDGARNTSQYVFMV